MSRRFIRQFGAKGVLADPAYGIFIDWGPTVPADGTPGYAVGADFYRTGMAGSTTKYRNNGSLTSSLFQQGSGGVDLTALTATAVELNTLHTQTQTGGGGAGFTGGTGTILKSSVQQNGDIYTTRFLIDLTGLASSTTDLDIIGVSTTPAYFTLLNAAQNGTTIDAVSMQCLEAPAGGVTDIDMYSATEGTGVFDGGIAALTETALVTSGGAWTNGATKGATVVPLSTEYLYLTGGAAGTAATYTAGKFLITLYGH